MTNRSFAEPSEDSFNLPCSILLQANTIQPKPSRELISFQWPPNKIEQKPEASEHFPALQAASEFPGICEFTFKTRLYRNNTINRAEFVLNFLFRIIIDDPHPVGNELVLMLTRRQ